MKVVVFANADGNLDLVNEILEKEKSCQIGISLGDLCMMSQSTPIERFLREKFRFQSAQSIEYNRAQHFFVKPVYAIYGCIDDPFIPHDELQIGNYFPIWNGVTNFMTYNESRDKSRIVKTGFISGYFNLRSFKNSNAKRKTMSRERKALALSLEDFRQFYKKHYLNVLFSYESPYGLPKDDMGCPLTSALIRETKAKLFFYGHHRSYIYKYVNATDFECDIIGLPTLEEMYAILDLYNETVKIIKTTTGQVIAEIMYAQEKESRNTSGNIL